VRAIVASFEKLYRSRSIDYREPTDDAFFQCQTVEGRAQALLGPKSVVGLTIARLRDALQRGLGDRLIMVPYRALTTCPQETLSLLHAALDLSPFEYDPYHVEQITQEDDTFHGMPLHTVRSPVEPPEEAPWHNILPAHICEWLATEYADINRLAAWKSSATSQSPRLTAQLKCNTNDGRDFERMGLSSPSGLCNGQATI
jgi:hypothetical protein